MRATLLRNGVLISVAALMLAGCTTSKLAPVTSEGLRSVVGTDLIGAKGKTQADQLKIDATAAGLCGGGIWSKSECARHGRESRS